MRKRNQVKGNSIKKNKFCKKKKSLISSVWDSESSSFECDENEVSLMAIETTCQESNSDDDVELVVVDLECEFLYALKKIKEFKCSRKSILKGKRELRKRN